MPLKTTTIGAYPKPACTPVEDWFMANKSEADRNESQGLLTNWRPGEYESAISRVGDQAETLFLEAIEQVINDQVSAGIDVPTDGEVRRENYILYQCRNLNGVNFEKITHKVVRDGAASANLPTIDGPISLKEIRLDKDWKTAQKFTKNPVKITLPGPLTIADSIANNFYDDPKKMGADLAEALNKEVLALAEAGCAYIQVDEPVFARETAAALAYGFENLERTFYGLPSGVTRVVHMCCGYPNAIDSKIFRKADKDAYFHIADTIEGSSIQEISFEDAHRHNELSLLEKFSKTKVIFGVVDIASSRMETMDEVRDRISAALEHIDEDRLVVAPDCGLGFFTREQAISKMKIMTEAARSI